MTQPAPHSPVPDGARSPHEDQSPNPAGSPGNPSSELSSPENSLAGTLSPAPLADAAEPDAAEPSSPEPDAAEPSSPEPSSQEASSGNPVASAAASTTIPRTEVDLESVIDQSAIRRAPKFGAFLTAGVLAGVVIGCVIGGLWLNSPAAALRFKPGVYFLVILVGSVLVTTTVAGFVAVIADKRSLQGPRQSVEH